MKKRYIILLFALLTTSSSFGQLKQSREFQYDSIQMLGNKFRYGYLEPNLTSDHTKYPLVLALHGAEWMSLDIGKEYETTPQKQFNNLFIKTGPEGWKEFNLATCWKLNDFFNKHPAYVLVPHLHDGIKVDNKAFNWEDDYVVSFLDSLIHKYILTGKVDENRIYITGHSMGGRGTLLAYNKLKYKAAALVPCSPAIFDYEWTENIKNGTYDQTAIWFFNPNIEDSGNAFEVLKEQANSVKYIKSAGMELQNITITELQQTINNRHRYLQTTYFRPFPVHYHMIMKYQVQDTLAYNWIFKQYLIDENAINIINISNDDYRVHWQTTNSNDTVEVWYRENNDWQLLTKNKFTQNTLTLSNYLTVEQLGIGYLKICCVNDEGFVYGLDERKLSEIPLTLGLISNVKSIIQAYPNPFKDYIKIINAPDLKKVELFDIQGNKIVTQVSSYLNTRILEPGIYFLRIERDNSTFDTIKLIKE